jgi:hypothetical protein
MDVSLNSSLEFEQDTTPKPETSEWLFHRQSLRRLCTTMSLVSLSLGFSVFGILIIVNRHRADLNGTSGDSFVAVVGGIGGLAIGTCFLVAACLHWKTIDWLFQS